MLDTVFDAAERLQQAAESARSAASPEELAPTARDLENAAERESRHERASGDEAAAQAAEALGETAEEMLAAQSDGERQAAADAAEARSEELKRSGKKRRSAPPRR